MELGFFVGLREERLGWSDMVDERLNLMICCSVTVKVVVVVVLRSNALELKLFVVAPGGRSKFHQ